LAKTGRGFRSLREQIDTTAPGGKLVFHLFGALAEFEREVIRERTKAGLSSARARGRTGGRPRRLDKKQAAMAAASSPTATAAWRTFAARWACPVQRFTV